VTHPPVECLLRILPATGEAFKRGTLDAKRIASAPPDNRCSTTPAVALPGVDSAPPGPERDLENHNPEDSGSP
jgi:hypothetical protein